MGKKRNRKKKKNKDQSTEISRLLDSSLIRIATRYCNERALRPASVSSYKKIVHILFKDTGLEYVNDLTTEKLLAWRELVTERASPTTFNNYHRHLRALLRYCVKEGLIESNPISSIKPYKRGNSRREPCSVNDLDKLCRYLSKDTLDPLSPVILLIVQTLAYTGMRRSQLCGLVWEDINFNNDEIHLRKQHSKTGKAWSIALHPHLRENLLPFKLDAMERFDSFRESDQVFWIQRYENRRRYAGSNLEPNQLTGILRRVSHRAEVKVSAHRIRHYVATTLANASLGDYHDTGHIPASLTAIKEMLGHSNITTTCEYIKPRLSTMRSVITALDIPMGIKEKRKRKKKKSKKGKENNGRGLSKNG